MLTKIPGDSSLLTTSPIQEEVNQLRRDLQLIYEELNNIHGDLASARNELVDT